MKYHTKKNQNPLLKPSVSTVIPQLVSAVPIDSPTVLCQECIKKLPIPKLPKPNPKDYGFIPNEGFDTPVSYWALEGGEEAYHEALKVWELSKDFTLSEETPDPKTERVRRIQFLSGYKTLKD